MRLPIFQVDAFAERPFEGNPAAVVPLQAWPQDALMQALAAENNLSETAFFVPEGAGFRLRWFTPAVEVDLCGHATLASAHVLFAHLGFGGEAIRFLTHSGELTVRREAGGLYAMDFPARRGPQIAAPEGLAEALGASPRLCLDTGPMLAVFDAPEEILALSPDFSALRRLCQAMGGIGLTVTAPYAGPERWDFVSRHFSPARGIDEDPVTGAAHTVLTPYWSQRLGRSDLVARQASRRGGTLWCTDAGERVILRGLCADYLKGEIVLPG
jgi:PhzF family phenazine biosynthesis protein